MRIQQLSHYFRFRVHLSLKGWVGLVFCIMQYTVYGVLLYYNNIKLKYYTYKYKYIYFIFLYCYPVILC